MIRQTKRGGEDRRCTERAALPDYVALALERAANGIELAKRTRAMLVHRGLAHPPESGDQRRTWLTEDGLAQLAYERSPERRRRAAAISAGVRAAIARKGRAA